MDTPENKVILDTLAVEIIGTELNEPFDKRINGVAVTTFIDNSFNYLSKRTGNDKKVDLLRKVLHVIFKKNCIIPNSIIAENSSITNNTQVLNNTHENITQNNTNSVLQVLQPILQKYTPENIVEIVNNTVGVIATLEKVEEILLDDDLNTDETFEQLFELLGIGDADDTDTTDADE